MIDEVPKFGNAIDDVDYFARDVAYTYTAARCRNIMNPRGGQLSGRTLSGICKRTAWRTDRRYTRWPLCAYSGS